MAQLMDPQVSPPEQKQPQFRRRAPSADQLPYGLATQLNRQIEQLDKGQPQLPQPISPFQPQIQPLQPQPVPPHKPVGDLTGFDDILFAPSDRPEEPITAGAPFGPGPMFVRQGYESDEEFLARIAAEIAESPNATSYVKSFAARVLNGE